MSASFRFSGIDVYKRQELEKLEADKLRREVPCLPDELFDRLPDFLKRGLTHVRNKRERDILSVSYTHLDVYKRQLLCRKLSLFDFIVRRNTPMMQCFSSVGLKSL